MTDILPYHLPASGDFCRLLNSLDPDQDRQDVAPDLDQNCFSIL